MPDPNDPCPNVGVGVSKPSFEEMYSKRSTLKGRPRTPKFPQESKGRGSKTQRHSINSTGIVKESGLNKVVSFRDGVPKIQLIHCYC